MNLNKLLPVLLRPMLYVFCNGMLVDYRKTKSNDETERILENVCVCVHTRSNANLLHYYALWVLCRADK